MFELEAGVMWAGIWEFPANFNFIERVRGGNPDWTLVKRYRVREVEVSEWRHPTEHFSCSARGENREDTKRALIMAMLINGVSVWDQDAHAIYHPKDLQQSFIDDIAKFVITGDTYDIAKT